MKPVAWNGIHFQLPDDWELLQFSKNADKGRAVFGDRYQFRFEIDWAAINTPPDLERMSTDYKSKLIQDGIKEPRTIAHHPWKGVAGLEGQTPISRYCAYFTNRTLLLEAVFLWPPDPTPSRNQAFEAKILDTIHVMPFQEDGRQEWNAFGIHCLAPEAHPLTECVANPADVKLTFSNAKETETETVARTGFLKVWLTKGVDDWLKSIVPKDYTVLSLNHTSQEEHDIWLLEATISRADLKDWWKGRRHFTAAAWICPADKRLYTVTKAYHEDKNGNPHLPISLSCCHQLEITL